MINSLLNLSPRGLISTLNHVGTLESSSAASGTNWPAANKAFYAAVLFSQATLITKLYWINGSAVSGNVDCGIFHGINFTKLCSTGATAQSGTGTIQIVILTNPCLITPGVHLFGISHSGTGRIVYFTRTDVGGTNSWGGFEETSAHPLPAVATPVVQTATFIIPFMGGITNNSGL